MHRAGVLDLPLQGHGGREFEWHAAFRAGRRALVLHAGTHRTDVLPGDLHRRLTARAFASASAAAGTASIRFGQPRQHRLRISLERLRSEEHTSELQSLMRISYAVFCLKKKN